MIWAIASKDIADALKNWVIASTLVIVLLMVAFYKFLPVITGMAHLPEVDIVDLGQWDLATYLESSPNLAARQVASQEEMATFVVMEGVPALGLVVPVDFDAQVAAGSPVALDGYVQHWVSDAAAAELRAKVEQEITISTGQPVRIQLEGHELYPALASMGPHSWAVLSIVVALALLGLSLTPQLMFEEKRTRTMDAILVSPASSGHIVAGKALAGLFFCLIGAALVLAFNAALIVQWGFAILALVLGGYLSVAIGLLFGITLQTPQSLRLWSMVVILPLFILPVVLSSMAMDLPPAVNTVVRWFPTTAISRLFILSMTRSAPFAEWGADVAVALGAIAIFLTVVAWLVRRSDRLKE